MKILIDTREQLPLDFDHAYITDIVRVKLNVGDYGCEFKNGFRPGTYFERKSIGDLFGTLSTGYKRFKREILRAQSNKQEIILIIEGTLTKVSKGYEHSNIPGERIRQQLFTLWEKYNVLPVFCKNRQEMAIFIIEYYSAIGRKAIRDLKGRNGDII